MPLGTLFLEATQRKTERMVTTVLRVDPKVAEAQAVGIASRRERRPAEPVVADVIQRTGAARAEARGRVPLGTRRLGFSRQSPQAAARLFSSVRVPLGCRSAPYSWRQRN